jgi:hypothetical protein
MRFGNKLRLKRMLPFGFAASQKQKHQGIREKQINDRVLADDYSDDESSIISISRRLSIYNFQISLVAAAGLILGIVPTVGNGASQMSTLLAPPCQQST